MGKKDKLRGVWPHLRSLAVVSLILLLVTGVIFGVSMLRQALSLCMEHPEWTISSK